MLDICYDDKIGYLEVLVNWKSFFLYDNFRVCMVDLI